MSILKTKIMNQKQIGDFVKKNKDTMSYYRISKLSGCTQKQIMNLENGAKCNVRTLIKVCNAIGANVELIFDKK